MDIKKIKKAPYNPRRMSKESKRALRKSIEEYNDISGITINERTGNVLAGNHRWEELNSKYGKGNLVLTKLRDEYHALDTKDGQHTGFVVRIVDWDEIKEKGANVVANSDLISGEFTSGLQDILLELSPLMEIDSFEEMRLDELTIDMDGLDEDFDWEPETADTIQKEALEKNRALEDAKGEEPGEVKEVLVNIKLVLPGDLKDELKADLAEWLASREEYSEVQII